MPSWTENIDDTDPANTGLVSGGAEDIRELKTALLERMNSIFASFNADPLVPIVGFFMTNAGVPTSGVAGTGAGAANPGCFCFDSTNKVLYMNINTKASPTWAPFILGDSV